MVARLVEKLPALWMACLCLRSGPIRGAFCDLIVALANTVATVRSVANATRPFAAIGATRKSIKAHGVVSISRAFFEFAASLFAYLSKSRGNGLSTAWERDAVANAATPCSVGTTGGPFDAEWVTILSWLIRRVAAFTFYNGGLAVVSEDVPLTPRDGIADFSSTLTTDGWHTAVADVATRPTPTPSLDAHGD
jgi:hypothetical protein